MKNLLFGCIVTLSLMSIASAAHAQKPAKTLRHVVLFSFKDSSTPEDIKNVEAAFAALPAKISQIKALEWGTNNSPEGLDQGHTHCFLLTFASEEDRDDYLVHPDHKVFGSIVGPHIDKVTVVDYWADASAAKGKATGKEAKEKPTDKEKDNGNK